jgi:glycosyltransferase involved in cell wall biosynthesis
MARLLQMLLKVIAAPLVALLFFGMLLMSLFRRKQKRELVWGPVPIINNKYWSEAMRKAGWTSRTLMHSFYSINKREDYDLYFDDLVPRWVWPSAIRARLSPYFSMLYIIRNAGVVHLPFYGGPLGPTPLWRLEYPLLRLAGVRTVLIPYGADTYMYSRVMDPSLRNALLMSYPAAARKEASIAQRVSYWMARADITMCGFGIDGMGRWDVPVNNFVCIDTDQWQPRSSYSSNDGVNGMVKVIHTPNHRGFKGTEFLIQAVEELKAEGLKVELILLEKVSNSTVQRLMQEADVLAEQFIATAYALSAIEGMASGLTVMSNLEDEAYTRVFRRYAFLNECPIVSTSPETIKRNLEVLIRNPELRRQLGEAGRQYAEKYHSYETAQYLFGSIYDKLLDDKEVDLMNLFHPLKSEYNRRRPVVEHPLIESQLPAEYFTKTLGAKRFVNSRIASY